MLIDVMNEPLAQESLPAVQNRWLQPFALVSFAAILFGIKLLVIRTYGNATPFWDQWDGEATRLFAPFIEGRLGWRSILMPHNEHHSTTSWLLALGLLMANGLWNPILQMVVNAALHVGFICLVVVLLERVVSRQHRLAILAFAFVLFSWPYAWENTLAGFQSCFYFLLLFSVGAIWLIDRSSPFSARWWAGVGLAVLGFFSLASGVFAPAALAAVGVLQYLLGIKTSRLHAASVLTLGGLFMLGVALTPSIPGHASLKAASAAQFFSSWNSVMGWPIKVAVLGPVVRNAPAILFALMMIRTRPAAADMRWFLLTLVVWMFGQGSAIAYGRAVGPVASRYMDLFAIDLLTNFACLLALVGNSIRTPGITALAAVTWTAVVLGCLGASVHKHCPHDLQSRLETARAQELNTRNYVCTGDINHLTDKPFLHVPYPDSKRLAALLDDPAVRAILPKNIGVPMLGSLVTSSLPADGIGNGYGPDLPTPLARAWGTFGKERAATTGTAAIAFAADHRGYRVEIPVAGQLQSEGISLEVEQDGNRWPLQAGGAGTNSWALVVAEVRGRPFTLHIADASPEAWIAVGSPVAVGRWDGWVERLLARWDLFVIFGAVTAVALLTFVSLVPAEPVV